MKTVLAPNAPWPKPEEKPAPAPKLKPGPKPKAKPKAEPTKKPPSKIKRTSMNFEQWASKNLKVEI